MKVGVMLAIYIVLIVLGPFATLWSLNTLFPVLAIPYEFNTWCAAALLGGLIGNGLKGNIAK